MYRSGQAFSWDKQNRHRVSYERVTMEKLSQTKPKLWTTKEVKQHEEFRELVKFSQSRNRVAGTASQVQRRRYRVTGAELQI